MDSTSSNLVMLLFDEAAELEEPSRVEFLNRRCSDRAVRNEVESLLNAYDESGGFLSEKTGGNRRLREPGPEPHQPGSRIGNYALGDLLGEGGFARVFQARQIAPVRRDVAVKIIKLGMDTRAVIARFELERQALAMMDHPGIAAVYDAGATDVGRPYFVMELVRGERITHFADSAKLDVRARARLFIDVCNAVQHAHQKGILHRDLKPSNILVTTVDRQPQPKVIDFGIAKATQGSITDATFMTAEQQMLGTPRYMSPEQAISGGADVDTRSDIYSLGTVLYELMTGAPPMQDASPGRSSVITDLHRLRIERATPLPSTRVDAARRRELRGELDWIIVKCLSHDRAQRYESAAALATDLQAHLDHRPIVAAPPRVLYRIKKFVRRNALAVSAAAIVLIALLAGSIVSTTQAIRATRAEHLAQRRLEESRAANASLRAVNDFLTEDVIGSADPAITRGRELTVREALDNAAKGLASQRHDQPLNEATVRYSVSAAYLKLGLVEPALTHAQEALRLRETLWGHDHPDTVKSLLQHAMALHAASRYAEAEPLSATALSRSQRINGEDHVDTIEARQSHAITLLRLGRVAEAEAELAIATRQNERVMGTDHKRTVETLNDYALAVLSLGRPVDAEPLTRDALERARRMGGDDHPTTIIAQHNYARALSELGRHDEALAQYEEALRHARRVTGDDSPSTIHVAGGCAKELMQLGRMQEAELLLAPIIERLHATDGFNRREAILALDAYGQALAGLKKIAESEPIRRDVVNRLTALLGENHPDTVAAMNNYGVTLTQLGRRAEGLVVYQQVLARRRELHGDDHPRTLVSLNNVASSLRSLGRFEESLDLSEELYQKATTAQISPASAAIYMSHYGICLVGLARYEEAEAPLLEAIRRFRESKQAQDIRMVKLLRSLAEVYDRTNRGDAAVQSRAEAESIRSLPSTQSRD